uniref:FERM domain-containing protein n=1 Tax=Macrostomum lignano TaxID=282301 RepID=A0A1I8FXU4_9PLAT
MPSLLKRSRSGSSRGKRTDEWSCEVKLLHDDQPLELKFHRDILGQGVLDQVSEQIGNLQEKDYFGLQYISTDNQTKWLDLRNPAFKQLKRRLYSSNSRDIVHLAACIVQAEFGDFDSIAGFEHRDYLGGVVLSHNQTPKLESLIYEEHATLKGKSTQEAEAMFLEKAFALDTYGIEPKPVRDRNGNSLFLGLSHRAVVTFHGSKLTHSFPWESINHIRVQDKMLLLEINLSSTKRHLLGFKCESKAAASALWASSLEQQLFFTLNKGSEARVVKSNDGFLRRRRNSFRFSGRSQKELLSSSNYFLNVEQTAPPVVRVKRSSSMSSCPTVRRLPSVRKRLRYSSSDSSDGSDISSVSQSRRAQANQAEAAKRDTASSTRFATYPGRKRPEVEEAMEAHDQASSGADSKADSVFEDRQGLAASSAAASSHAATGESEASAKAASSASSAASGAKEAGEQSAGVEVAQSSDLGLGDGAPASEGDAEVKDVQQDQYAEEVTDEAVVAAVSSATVESASPIEGSLTAANGNINPTEVDEVHPVEPEETPTTVAVASAESFDDNAAVAELDQVLEHHEVVKEEAGIAAAVVAASAAASNGNSSVSTNQHRDTAATASDLIRPVSRTQAALVLTAAFSLLTLVGLVLFYEANLTSPTMRSLREHPLVYEFYDRVYAPIRGRLV